MRNLVIVAFVFFVAVEGTLGGIECENLNQDTCAFAVSYAGKRCVLEKHVKRNGEEKYTCRTSEIEADKLKDHIESDQCIKSCGLDRKSFGISSDSLLESSFTKNLCSPQCYKSCPNIVDLYFNLAAGEGVFLPKLCEAQGANARREMAEIKSSGIAAPGPLHSGKFVATSPESSEAMKLTVEPPVAPTIPPY
ncbi:hypothetical protein MtrunA17_Chr6g0472041 [Medicago truncatula]|uniref:PAR1 protein n=1 Tax=Medicago truncatula TaxID=3880 RepID=A0A072UA78_MEDTR|nr:uncharacterized protein LOC25497091 [Medicago truncatula]KEH26321.1 PAR1 protein [Medicago truncatula]RHN51724.1 hypothetical protein MtrunA17_Chr6g0472041 [Medicago truncatula]